MKLPSGIESAIVPHYFSPSQWTRMEACPLSVWARSGPTLPEQIETTVGQIFHRARELVLRGVVTANRPEELADRALKAALEDAPAFDGCPVQQEALARDLGRCRWIDLVGDLRRWAATVRNVKSRPLGLRRAPSTTETEPTILGDAPDEISVGAERTWTCNKLRLRGRPDESCQHGDLSVEIHDYKSSPAAFLGGAAHAAAVVQLRLYLLMAEMLTRQTAIGFLVGRTLTAVSWDRATREDLLARVNAARSTFVAGEVMPSEEIARPGVHCMRCDLRPRCSSYLSQVPAWWRDIGAPPRPMPLDVWGRIERLERDVDGLCVWLRDAAGRLVVARGLQTSWQLDQISASATVYFFGLEASEDLLVHGRRVHPSAFHEFTRAAGRRPARRLRIYVES